LSSSFCTLAFVREETDEHQQRMTAASQCSITSSAIFAVLAQLFRTLFHEWHPDEADPATLPADPADVDTVKALKAADVRNPLKWPPAKDASPRAPARLRLLIHFLANAQFPNVTKAYLPRGVLEWMQSLGR
jgi:hypothetical protein